jgi:dTDP-glucose 4,6-dehydratase
MPREAALITGGAGFIGSHICERLLGDGLRVIAADNFLTSSRRNIARLFSHPRFHFIRQDVNKPLRLSGKVDYCLHFASPASPEDYLRHPVETLKVGSFGTYNLLELALRKKAKFMLASTSEVYGDPLVHPQPEAYWGNVNSVGVRSCYDEAKRFAEAMTMAFHRARKAQTQIIRIFNTYGPRMRCQDGRVVPNFIFQALAGKPLTVYGSGQQTRSFCYVDDLVEGIMLLMRAGVSEPVNLGNPGEFTIIQLAKIVLRITGAKSRLVFKPLPQDDPKQRKPDISRAKRLLRWEPKVGLEDGLKRTIAWFGTRAP